MSHTELEQKMSRTSYIPPSFLVIHRTKAMLFWFTRFRDSTICLAKCLDLLGYRGRTIIIGGRETSPYNRAVAVGTLTWLHLPHPPTMQTSLSLSNLNICILHFRVHHSPYNRPPPITGQIQMFDVKIEANILFWSYLNSA